MIRTKLTVLLTLLTATLYAQNVGINENNPASTLSIKGNIAVGEGYTTTQAPADGAIIKGYTAIGNNAANTQLDVNGAISNRPAQTTVALSSNYTPALPYTVTVGNSSYIKLSSNNASPLLRVFTLSAGLQAGQVLFLENTTPTFGLRLQDGANVDLVGDTLNLGNSFKIKAVHLLWTGTKWIDIGYNPLVAYVAAPAEPSNKLTFQYTGANQSWTVPAGITLIKVKLWAAGGGGGNNSGAGGGFVSGYLTVTPGESLTIIVGGGGLKNASAFGGGGRGYSTTGTGGGGGGRSAIRRSTTELATAGAGGGGGTGSIGGVGGGATGADGAVPTGCTTEHGKGGTQSAGGAAGVACTGSTYNGVAGTQYTGGSAAPTSSTGIRGGGGGAGYYGGGGGGAGSHGTLFTGAGGAGGSSYVGSFLGTYTIQDLQGSGINSGGAADSDYPTSPLYVGRGWGGGSDGGNGFLVIYY